MTKVRPVKTQQKVSKTYLHTYICMKQREGKKTYDLYLFKENRTMATYFFLKSQSKKKCRQASPTYHRQSSVPLELS